MCSSRGFCNPGPWRCEALEHKEPLLFPNSTSKRQGGPDALGSKLRNSNEVSPLLQLPGRRTCSEGATIHHCPVWEGEGTSSPFVVPCPFTMNCFCIKTLRATVDRKNGIHFR